MEDDKFKELQHFLQIQATQAWWKTQRDPDAFSTVADTFGHNFELQLQTNSRELDKALTILAEKSINEELSSTFDPIDFSTYIRTSSQPGYMEVYVGEKWVVVPEDTCVEFSETNTSSFSGSTSSGFKVTLHEEGSGNWAEFEHSQSLNDYENQMSAIAGEEVDVQLMPAQHQNKDTGVWEDYGRPTLEFSQKQIGFADDLINGPSIIAGNEFLKQSGEIRRDFTLKVSKTAQKFGSTVKNGPVNKKIHELARLAARGKLSSLSKITKPLGPIGNVLTTGVIIDEVISDQWDAHTVVDGTLLVVGVVASIYGAPLILAGIAVYGIADYFFDIGKSFWDPVIGKKSGLWDENVQEAPVDREVLFQRAVDSFENSNPWEKTEIKIDNTEVRKPLQIKSIIKG